MPIVCPSGCAVMTRSTQDQKYLRCPVCERRLLAHYEPAQQPAKPSQHDEDRMWNYDSHRASLHEDDASMASLGLHNLE